MTFKKSRFRVYRVYKIPPQLTVILWHLFQRFYRCSTAKATSAIRKTRATFMAKTQMAMNVCNKTKVEQCLVVSVSVIVVPVFVDFLLMFFFCCC